MEFKIEFEGTAKGEATILAEDLRKALREADADISADVARDSTTSMDMGASVLVALASTPAALVLARAVLAWAKAHSGTSFTIYKNGVPVATASNVKSGDAAGLAGALEGKKR